MTSIRVRIWSEQRSHSTQCDPMMRGGLRAFNAVIFLSFTKSRDVMMTSGESLVNGLGSRKESARRKSDPGTCRTITGETIVAAELPWGSLKLVSVSNVDYSVLPSQFAVKSLLQELFGLFDRKLQNILDDEHSEKLLSRCLQIGDDTYMDNLMRALNGVCEHCLPSVLSTVIQWYENQMNLTSDEVGDRKIRFEKRQLAVHYLLCVVLVEVLPQIHFFPQSCEQSVSYIVTLAFKEVAYRDPASVGVNYNNFLSVAERYAEVLGVLSQSHAPLIQRTFLSQLGELKKEAPVTPATVNNIIALLMAMKFFRVKTNEVGDFEMGIRFLDELGQYYLDVKHKDIKHAVAGLLVEILLPVAAQIKTEANIPALISFVDKLYAPTFELVNKKRDKMAAYPLLTCLLCISQSKFFLSNWTQFLTSTLASLKSKDSKVSRVALESLYRLLWVYVIRNNCEGNTATRNRLESICSSLFPKGNRAIIPRDAPLNIFVKIIHFIAQQKLDFAFKEIIFDLLGCNRAHSVLKSSLYPERMNIGIRALMVIANGLQQKEGPPDMPRSMASSATQRMKKTYISRPLTADIARSIGLEQYYAPCRKAFDTILRALDAQVGKPLLLTATQTRGKDPEELLTGEVKPKLDLFRTCVAAIPRLLPDSMSHAFLTIAELRFSGEVKPKLDLFRTCVAAIPRLLPDSMSHAFLTIAELRFSGEVKPKLDLFRTCVAAIPRLLPDSMSHAELVELLVRMNVHIDEELRVHAAQTLQTLMGECADWREDVVHAILSFLTNHILDTYPSLLDSSLRLLYQLIFTWKTAAHIERKRETNGASDKENGFINPLKMQISPLLTNSVALALHSVEGFALAMMCQYRAQSRKIAISILREVRQLLLLVTPQQHDTPVIEVLDNATPYVLNKYIEHVPLSERQSWNQDFSSASDKIGCIETDNCLVNSDRGNEYFYWDPWACALSGYCEHRFLITQCPTAIFYAWPVINVRLNACNSFVDPSNPQNESRASLLRSSKSKGTASSLCGESLGQDSYLSLWQKYLVMACALAPPPPNSVSSLARSFSPTSSIDNDSVFRSFTSSVRGPRVSSGSASGFYQKIIAMLRWEQMTDMRDSVVLGVGSTSPLAFESLLDEMKVVLRETMERKTDNNARRKKRKDLLRLQIIRVLQVATFRGVLPVSGCIDPESGLCQVLVDFIESMRQNLESDQDRDVALLTNLRLHFAKTIALLVNSIPPEKRHNLMASDKKQSLFFLFTSWCSRSIASSDRRREGEVGTYVEQRAVEAMCALLCCGPIFESTKSIGEDGYLYGWLETLLESTNPVLEKLVESTLSIMLDLNDETAQLLDWTVNVCYSKPAPVAAKCFRALVMLFSKREYPCEFDSLFVLCQMLAADSDSCVSEPAVELLHLLRRQFLDDSLTTAHPQSGMHNFSTNQLEVCRLLAKTYPKITMSVFSEVCSRVESARCNRRSAILMLLSAWIENIQLVDSHVDPCDIADNPKKLEDEEKQKAEARGWGSEEATQLILNNLLHITATLSIEHSSELSVLWNTLATSYSTNLSIIINYLFVMASLSPDSLLPHTKRVCCFLIESCGVRLVDSLISHLENVNEQFNANLERCEMPPYYRWQSVSDFREKDNGEGGSRSQSVAPTDTNASTIVASELMLSPKQVSMAEDEVADGVNELPMPAYGGHYSVLSSLLPPTTQPVVSFSRCNLALMHICDLIRCGSNVEWHEHIPLVLHVAVLGLDSLRPSICAHSRQTIINVVLLHASDSVPIAQVANILLSNQMNVDERGTSLAVTEENRAENVARGETPTFSSIKFSEYRQMLLKSNALFSSESDLVQAIIFCMSEKMDRPLWANEDVTVRQWRIESAEQLGCVVRHLAELLIESIPLFAVRWTQLAMGMALSISNRHIAGRCFQIASALCQSPSPWIPGVLSRLVETVGEQHEDTQSYVTDVMLCLHTTVAHLALVPQAVPTQSPQHARSVSYTPALLRQTAMATASAALSPTHDRKEVRHSVLISEERDPPPGLSRSKSATALKSTEHGVGEEDLSALCQLLSISVAMLESNNDNEYLLALHLLDKILDAAGTDRTVCLQRLSKTVAQLDWTAFSGIVGLVVKGTVIAAGYELSLSLLVKCVEAVDEPAMGCPNAVPLIIASGLPNLMLNFDSPAPLCITVASGLASFLKTRFPDGEGDTADNPINHLAAMMRQYAERCFSRDRFQWAKCVVKYLCDAFTPDITQLIVLLSEMLERCTVSLHMCVLHCIYLLLCHGDLSRSSRITFNAQMLERCTVSLHMCVLHCIYLLLCHGDLSRSSRITFNAQVIRAVSKHLQGPNWKEAARVLKCIVQLNNIAAFNGQNQEGTAAIGEGSTATKSLQMEMALNGCATPPSPRKSVVDSSSLRRHYFNQAKVRERLVSLLNASGLRVGLPKSASVIFSQSSHDLSHEPAGSAASSTEKIALSHGGDIETASSLVADPSVTDSFPRVFREFDFLEAEHDSVSESTESCFNWLSTMRPRSISNVDVEADEQYQDDECTEIAAGQRPSSADSLEVSSERTPLQSETRSETTEEEESCDEELEEEEFAMEEERQRVADVSSLAESIQCSRSEVSEECSRSRQLPLFLECNHHSSGQSEQQWLSCFTEVNNDETGELTAHASLLFSQLYRECCVKLSGVLRDASHLLSSPHRDISSMFADALDLVLKISDCPFLFVTAQYECCVKLSGVLRDASHLLSSPHRDISSMFADALDLVLKISDCPFLFVTAQYLRSCGLLSNQKCVLLELHEHYETFVERKEQCIRSLNGVRATMKLAMIGGSSSSVSNTQYLELCKSVHKLFFQMLLMSDKLDDMIKGVGNTAEAQDLDMSSEVLCLHRCLLASIPDSVHSAESLTAGTRMEPNFDFLLFALQKKQYKNALHAVRQLRLQYGAEFGCCDQVDVEVLLLAYCRSHSSASWAVLGSHKALSLSCAQLREMNMQMAALVRSLAPDAVAVRSSRVSSASESFRP
ncbi:Protein furry -like protein-like [Toxocara canis]|uniref:Protein furry-like protein-like n=1 Tax=Toxocara canis TaxID=6265 RepID=A0A0B2UUZ4_TOXCA|nr:Protein furry -like protein-like [Toxocara canis]